MPNIRIIKAGLSTTVQDLGRPGHGSIGVSASGCADRLSLRLGNRLLNNPDHTAALEATLLGPTVELSEPHQPNASRRFLLAGASVNAHLETPTGSRPIPMWRPFELPPSARLAIGTVEQGCRVYLIASAGFATMPVLSSRAVHASTAIAGTCLRDGDIIPIAEPTHHAATTHETLPDHFRESLLSLIRTTQRHQLRIILAPTEDAALLAAQQALLTHTFTVDRDSDRIGIRLSSVPSSTSATFPQANPLAQSQAVTFGCIQWTPDGRLIALGPDAAPTGGYPILATVIAADLPALSQKRPADQLTFESITIERAWQLWREQESALNALVPASPTSLRHQPSHDHAHHRPQRGPRRITRSP